MRKPNSPAREAAAGNSPAGRSRPEWIATHPDQAIPKAVRLRIWEREGGRCYLTGLKINALKDTFEFEHVIALANGGEHRETNIRLALTAAHKVKTASDVKTTAKIRRVALKHLGQWPEPVRKLQGRGFSPSRTLSLGDGGLWDPSTKRRQRRPL